MSENLDLVRSIYADWERGDYTPVGGAHPNIEWAIAGRPAPGRWTGVAAMARGWRDFLSAWEGHGTQAAELAELDGGRVLAFANASARGRTSGIDVAQWTAVAVLFEISAGAVTRLVIYMDRDRVLADLGLTE